MPGRSADALAGFTPPVPDAVARRAAGFPAQGEPSEPVPSASVVLVRDAPGPGDDVDAGGIEVYLLHRHARMAFAASMAVFPGGKVDEADRGEPDVLRACACRETAEETGVRLVPDDLRLWAHWITPASEPLRFDTVFYVAAAPPGQEAADLSTETERAGWLGAVAALGQRERGVLALMPPTWAILRELASMAGVADVLAGAVDRHVQTVLPRLVPTVSGWAYDYEVLDR